MHSTDEVLGWRSRKALDRDGDKLGTIEEVYLDAESGNPQWAAVKTGLFGSKLTFVPLEGARVHDDDVMLDWPEHVVKEAPRIDADGELSPEEEDRLYDHYERYDTPEHHGASTSAQADDAVPAAAEGAAVSRGVGRDDDDDHDTGARARGGPEAGPGAGSATRSTAGETTSAGDRSSAAREAYSSDERSSAGQTASSGAETSSSADASPSSARRPRIKRFIEEELGPDGNPVRRSTRTEEIFE